MTTLSSGQFRQQPEQPMLPGMANVTQPGQSPAYRGAAMPAQHGSRSQLSIGGLMQATVPETTGGGQLGMFYTPAEIKQHWLPHQPDRHAMVDPKAGLLMPVRSETDPEMWDRKAREAEQHGLTASIAERGVVDPVQLQFRRAGVQAGVLGGHHRIAAQAVLNPNQLMAVEHFGNITEAKASGHYGGSAELWPTSQEFAIVQQRRVAAGRQAYHPAGIQNLLTALRATGSSTQPY